MNPEVPGDYRPKSNLPFLSKILEKAVAKQLCRIILEDPLKEFQSGFRNHSTETALRKVSNDLFTVSDEGLITIPVLLHLSAAFDIIDHHILLQKMEHHNDIKGSALRWFKSYLSDRYNYFHFNFESSRYDKVSHGVP